MGTAPSRTHPSPSGTASCLYAPFTPLSERHCSSSLRCHVMSSVAQNMRVGGQYVMRVRGLGEKGWGPWSPKATVKIAPA